VIWHRGGGHKKAYRKVTSGATSSRARKSGGDRVRPESQGANLALLHYADGEKRYILHPVGLEVGG